jgi:hypothetical protein
LRAHPGFGYIRHHCETRAAICGIPRECILSYWVTSRFSPVVDVFDPSHKCSGSGTKVIATPASARSASQTDTSQPPGMLARRNRSGPSDDSSLSQRNILMITQLFYGKSAIITIHCRTYRRNAQRWIARLESLRPSVSLVCFYLEGGILCGGSSSI